MYVHIIRVDIFGLFDRSFSFFFYCCIPSVVYSSCGKSLCFSILACTLQPALTLILKYQDICKCRCSVAMLLCHIPLSVPDSLTLVALVVIACCYCCCCYYFGRYVFRFLLNFPTYLCKVKSLPFLYVWLFPVAVRDA